MTSSEAARYGRYLAIVAVVAIVSLLLALATAKSVTCSSEQPVNPPSKLEHQEMCQ